MASESEASCKATFDKANFAEVKELVFFLMQTKGFVSLGEVSKLELGLQHHSQLCSDSYFWGACILFLVELPLVPQVLVAKDAFFHFALHQHLRPTL
jgi:hypothetical protein